MLYDLHSPNSNLLCTCTKANKLNTPRYCEALRELIGLNDLLYSPIPVARYAYTVEGHSLDCICTSYQKSTNLMLSVAIQQGV